MTTADFIDSVKRYAGMTREKIGMEYLGVCKQSMSTTIRRNALRLRDAIKILDGTGLELVIVRKLPESRTIVCIENLIEELTEKAECEGKAEKKKLMDCVEVLKGVKTEEIR